MVIKLKRPTSTRLWFRARPSYWAISSAFAASLVAFFALAPELVVQCARSPENEITCELHRRLFGFALSDVIKGRLRTPNGPSFPPTADDSPPPIALFVDDTRRAALFASGNAAMLARSLNCGRRAHQRFVDELSEFVGAPFGPKTATIILPPNRWVWAAIVSPGLAGIALALFGWTRCWLDQESGFVTIEQPGLFSIRRQEYSFAAVDRFAIRQRWDPPSFDYEHGELRNFPEELRPRETSLVLALLLKNGREVTVVKRMFGGQRGLDFVRTLERFRNARQDLMAGGSSAALDKRCVVCGQECAVGTKYKDERGRYYHPACYEGIAGKVHRR